MKNLDQISKAAIFQRVIYSKLLQDVTITSLARDLAQIQSLIGLYCPFLDLFSGDIYINFKVKFAIRKK
jgi:hypothetical protein